MIQDNWIIRPHVVIALPDQAGHVVVVLRFFSISRARTKVWYTLAPLCKQSLVHTMTWPGSFFWYDRSWMGCQCQGAQLWWSHWEHKTRHCKDFGKCLLERSSYSLKHTWKGAFASGLGCNRCRWGTVSHWQNISMGMGGGGVLDRLAFQHYGGYNLVHWQLAHSFAPFAQVCKSSDSLGWQVLKVSLRETWYL